MIHEGMENWSFRKLVVSLDVAITIDAPRHAQMLRELF